MGPTDQLEITLLNRRREIARVQDELEKFAARHAIAARALHEVQLAVEEHLTNILSYAYEDDAEHRIIVRVTFRSPNLQIEVEDDGRPFNPVTYPAPDLTAPIDQRPVGGLGIHMMRKSLDAMEHRRVAGKNLLQMAKRI